MLFHHDAPKCWSSELLAFKWPTSVTANTITRYRLNKVLVTRVPTHACNLTNFPFVPVQKTWLIITNGQSEMEKNWRVKRAGSLRRRVRLKSHTWQQRLKLQREGVCLVREYGDTEECLCTRLWCKLNLTQPGNQRQTHTRPPPTLTNCRLLLPSEPRQSMILGRLTPPTRWYWGTKDLTVTRLS